MNFEIVDDINGNVDNSGTNITEPETYSLGMLIDNNIEHAVDMLPILLAMEIGETVCFGQCDFVKRIS